MAGSVTAPAAGPPPAWPRLREELRLYPGPRTRHGAPTWTLHDPPAQQFYRIGWLEMEILRRWDLASPEAVAEAVSRETAIACPPEAVSMVERFVTGNCLAVVTDREAVGRLLVRKRARKKGVLSLMLHNYLFIRIPLTRPDAFLTATQGWVRWMFTPAFLAVIVAAALAGLGLVLREWALFKDNLAGLLTLQGGLMAAAALGLSKTLHELGHAYAAKRLGLRVPAMGVALMCFAPVLWTDTTEAWKLPRRRDRLLVGLSGVMAELILAAAAALLWPLLPDGGLKTAAFMLAGGVWILTLTVNVNPCMRYDGYYLLSDYWNLPGLQARSFALAKWWLREALFGFDLPPPEPFSGWERTKLILYAFSTWLYRFFLFLGIALMVYYYFFKALGIVLMLVELGFFIALPILVEAAHWYRSREHMTVNLRLVRTVIVLAALAVFLAYPWHNRVGAAALLSASRRAAFYAPQGAIVEEMAARPGLETKPGQSLFKLRSPDLDARIEIVRRQVAAERVKLSLASLDAELGAEAAVGWQQLERQAEDLAGLLRERGELDIRAPFAGRLADVPEWLAPGGWVMAKEPLAALVGGEGRVQVFVPEYARARLTPGRSGLFYPSGKQWEPVRLRIEMIEGQATREIAYQELTSPYGGPLAAHKAEGDKLQPDHAVYRVLCRVEGPAPDLFMVGHASLEAEPQSLASEIWRKFLGLLVRESGW